MYPASALRASAGKSAYISYKCIAGLKHQVQCVHNYTFYTACGKVMRVQTSHHPSRAVGTKHGEF
jgi:hypothetical protein